MKHQQQTETDSSVDVSEQIAAHLGKLLIDMAVAKELGDDRRVRRLKRRIKDDLMLNRAGIDPRTRE